MVMPKNFRCNDILCDSTIKLGHAIAADPADDSGANHSDIKGLIQLQQIIKRS